MRIITAIQSCNVPAAYYTVGGSGDAANGGGMRRRGGGGGVGGKYSIWVSGVFARVRVLPQILGIGPDTDTGIGIWTTLITGHENLYPL